ncbi:MAG: XrtB/PEP-CTERM-associated polysaccharide biosynthesis outer membrane protein EpsL [Burkholderiales bacterium]
MRKPIAWTLCAFAVSLPAAAQDVLQLTAGASVTWDDNIFRRPAGPLAESDRFTATYAGLRLDKSYVQQRFLLDATLTAYDYHRFSYLDFDATQYRAAWNWRLSKRLAGILSADRSQSLVNYSDFRDQTQRNLRTTENRALTVDAWLAGGWHLTSTLLQQESRNSVAFLQERGFRQAGGDFGVKYTAGSGSTASLVRRWLGGEYVERALDPALLIDDGFKRTETEGAVSWLLGGRSTLQGRLARIEYQSDHFSARDFSGTAGELRVLWTASARLSLDFGASRSVSPSSDAFSRRVERRFTAGAAWALGARTALKASVYRGEGEFRDPVLPVAGPPREDDLSGASLALDWRVHRLVTLSAGVQRQKRSSSDARFDYRGTIATLGAALAY